jgi:Domain of unknown function (DUF4920)
MMRARFSWFVAAMALQAVLLQGAGSDTYGVAPTITETTPIATLSARPAEFVGKTVRVEGTVTAVCQMMGCWMALAPSDNPNGPTVRLKVDDGVIVFPVSAKGKRVSAQGVVERIDTGDAEGREAAAEHAHQEGRPAAASAAMLWHLKTTGAIVY